MSASPALVFLGQAALLIAVPYAVWRCTPIRFVVPLLVVQIIIGIALGPSLLGRTVPALAAVLLDPMATAALSGLAWLAVIMFAFLTGLHFDAAETRGRKGAFLGVALTSILLPAVMGTVAGGLLLRRSPELAGPSATPVEFALGVGVALAVTALPVLGAILREMQLLQTRLGRDALGYAACNDLVLWIMLAGLLAMADARDVPGAGWRQVLLPLVLGAGYLTAMFVAVRPLAARALKRLAETGESRHGDLVGVTALALTSAWITESIGLHYVLGAFIAGAVLPPACARPLIRQIEPYTVVLLLPFFFMLTGLRIDLQLAGAGLALPFWISTAVAIVGKLAGTAVAARLAGESWRFSLQLGALMQCKGLMDVVVVSILYDAGILGGVAFSALVLMAVATTAVTKPMIMLLGGPRQSLEDNPGEGERALAMEQQA
jgi:Kef-type K+ transport system membrane component KefB